MQKIFDKHNRNYFIVFLAIFSFILLIGLFYWINFLVKYNYIKEAFDNNSELYSHTVNTPLTTTTSCKNFCGPPARCSITGQQCTADIDCPGCGQGLSEEEWLDALVGFVSGVRDFEVGNPVRSRIVQTLRNTVTNMDTPHPRDVWELSVVARLMKEIERIVKAETLRISNDEAEQNFTVTEVQEMLQATEIETRDSMATEIWEDVVVQVQTALEPKLRKQIEQELWNEFEAELRRRQDA